MIEPIFLWKKIFLERAFKVSVFNDSTVSHFIIFYNKTDELMPKVSCPQIVSEEQKHTIVEDTELNYQTALKISPNNFLILGLLKN